MKWRYRTIVFEFAKDGLLGERYINDEEMETELNAQGDQGWDLVNVVMVHEGVLAVLKRAEEGPLEPLLPPEQESVEAVDLLAREEEFIEEIPEEEPPVTAEEIRRQEVEHIRTLAQNRRRHLMDMDEDEDDVTDQNDRVDGIDGIRIS